MKIAPILGLGCGGVSLIGGLVVFAVAGMFAGFTGDMADKAGEHPKIIEFECKTCGSTGSIVKGFGEIHEGSPCGTISGTGERCPGSYTVRERDMTAEELQEHRKAQKQWESGRAKAGVVRTLGLAVAFIGLLATVISVVFLVKLARKSG